MLQAVQNAFRLPDLRNKILFTLFILVIYRAVAHIPVPGIVREELALFFENNTVGALYNILSGGALANFSVLAMGVYPYITASIIMQLLQPLIPQLDELAKEGEQGRNQINRYTYLLAVPLAFLQGLGQIAIMRASNPAIFPDFGFSNLESATTSLAALFALTAGTMFGIWLGELITERGLGNGLSIIIFGGIISAAPTNIAQLWAQNPWLVLFFIVLMVVTVFVIVLIQQGERRVPVMYKRQVRGRRQVGGQTNYVPLRVNSTGMIPIIFAQSILIFPSLIAGYFTAVENDGVRNFATQVQTWLGPTSPTYWIIYFLMVVGFTYFYTDIVFRQQNIAETLRRQGGVIQGFREGPPTKTYLTKVMMRLAIVGALFLGLLAIFPWLVSLLLIPFGQTIDIATDNTFIISSVGLLIVVGVVLDTMKQLEAQLMMRHYERFIGR